MTSSQVRFADSTDNSRTVRRRIDPTAGNTTSMSPLTCAEANIISTTASLHSGIANLLRSLGKEYLTHMHELNVKCEKIKKMEANAEYQPISTRINFRLDACEAVKETQAFADLQSKVDDTLTQLKKDLREHVIECAGLQRSHLRSEARSTAITLVMNTVSIFATAYGIDQSFVHPLALEAIKKKGDLFLTHLQLTPDAFATLYSTEQNATNEVVVLPDRSDDLIKGVGTCLHGVMKTSWDAYLAQEKQNELTISINKRAKLILSAKSTEEAAMEVDKEASMSHKYMDELIAKKAKQEVQRQMRQFQSKIKAERGNDVSASQKKKTAQEKKQEQKSKQEKGKGKNGKDKADESRTDSGKAKKGKGKKGSNAQQHKTKKGENRRKKTSSTASTQK